MTTQATADRSIKALKGYGTEQRGLPQQKGQNGWAREDETGQEAMDRGNTACLLTLSVGVRVREGMERGKVYKDPKFRLGDADSFSLELLRMSRKANKAAWEQHEPVIP